MLAAVTTRSSTWPPAAPARAHRGCRAPPGAGSTARCDSMRSRARRRRRVIGRASPSRAWPALVLVVTGGAQDFLSLFQPSQLARSTGDGSGCSLPRRARQLRHGQRRVARSRSSPSRMRPAPAAAAGLRCPGGGGSSSPGPPRRSSPSSRAASWPSRSMRGLGPGGGRARRPAAAPDAIAGSTAAPCPCRSRPRSWSRTVSIPPPSLQGGASVPTGEAFVVVETRTPTVSLHRA